MRPTKRTAVGENPREADPGPPPHTTLTSGQDEQASAPVSTWVLQGFRGQRERATTINNASQTWSKHRARQQLHSNAAQQETSKSAFSPINSKSYPVLKGKRTDSKPSQNLDSDPSSPMDRWPSY